MSVRKSLKDLILGGAVVVVVVVTLVVNALI
jgi:hypothetical protein